MRLFKKIAAIFGLIIVTLAVLVYIFIETQKPLYDGTIALAGFNSKTTIYYDTYGIPHIYGENSTDVFRALGYIHAQDRLFQMELVRRVASGRLSEIFGSSMIQTDQFFRMLGFNKQAEKLAKEFDQDDDEEWKTEARAYVDGINEYVEKRNRRLEFKLLDIPTEKYSINDIYLIVSYMAFNFQMGFRTDPLLTQIQHSLGNKYLVDLGLPAELLAMDSVLKTQSVSVTSSIDKIISTLPVPVWMGSNAIVIGPDLSASGKALLENDTHIGLQQPAVWHEAYLNYPGFRFYGSFLAGFPFAPLGHTLHHGWGITILENDDLDFFVETTLKSDSNVIIFNDTIERMESREEIIKVKDSADVKFIVRTTHHGPICSDIVPDIRNVTHKPVSISWTFLKVHNNLPSVTWGMAHACNMDEFRKAVSDIGAPGLNILYADADNNIAWYSAAKYVQRTPGTHSNVFLDGSGSQEWKGYYDFDVNPKSENPVVGYLFSTNTAPSPDSASFFPGYYLPQDRFLRVNHLLREKKKFKRTDLETISLDVINPVAGKVCENMVSRMPSAVVLKTQMHERAFSILSSWNGSHKIDDTAPVIYYKLLYHVLKNTFADELGEKDFESFLKTHLLKTALPGLMQNDSSVWWDNVKTIKIETEPKILQAAFDTTITELIAQLGFNPDKWKWGDVHQIEYEHPIGKQKPFNKLYNIGPFPTWGGMETVNNQSFDMNGIGKYKVNLSPGVRRTLDFADPENATSIIPSGESGNFTVRYYRNQAKMYINGRFRKEMMNDQEIKKTCKNVLIITPQK